MSPIRICHRYVLLDGPPLYRSADTLIVSAVDEGLVQDYERHFKLYSSVSGNTDSGSCSPIRSRRGSDASRTKLVWETFSDQNHGPFGDSLDLHSFCECIFSLEILYLPNFDINSWTESELKAAFVACSLTTETDVLDQSCQSSSNDFESDAATMNAMLTAGAKLSSTAVSLNSFVSFCRDRFGDTRTIAIKFMKNEVPVVQFVVAPCFYFYFSQFVLL
jgi:hypothetical protein